SPWRMAWALLGGGCRGDKEPWSYGDPPGDVAVDETALHRQEEHDDGQRHDEPGRADQGPVGGESLLERVERERDGLQVAVLDERDGEHELVVGLQAGDEGRGEHGGPDHGQHDAGEDAELAGAVEPGRLLVLAGQ